MKITIVIPTYNELENLPKIVSAVFELPLPELKVLVVDDDSPDGTGKLADELVKQYPSRLSVLHREGKLGLGTAYIRGFEKALADGAEYIVQMDADFSHPPEKIVEFAETIKHCDVVIGSRYVRGGELDKNWPFWRKALSWFGNYYARFILNASVLDVTGGFRFWRRDTLLGIPLDRVRSNGYAFQIEMIYIAHRLGYQSKEVPIYFAERDLGKSKMSIKIQIEAAYRVWQMRNSYQDLHPIVHQKEEAHSASL
ncbi:MAG: polyprenol monophosphomannose synthase [Anaerolineales bacterium]|nr:polyprenol monophosphomannose synthase [Chloroflexota bacterium]MBL6982897.1 polyprenol monophosphomannose synthase [Anaerolineales bacterium]